MKKSPIVRILRQKSVLVLVVGILFGRSGHAQTQSPDNSAASTAAATRSCSANPVLSATGKKKHVRKTKHPLPPEPPPACIEAKGESLEIQEYLQSAVRELQWNTGEDHVSEDTWTFVRDLGEQDLEKYADTKVLLEPVEFTGGKCAVLVRTADLGDGFVRVQIIVHVEGNGKSTDSVVKQPATVWPLASKGVLEQELIGQLQNRNKHVK